MITTVNLLIVGVSLFSYFAFSSPEPCPRIYMVTKDQGGELAISADIHRYCELDYGGKFVLKEGQWQKRIGEINVGNKILRLLKL